MSKAKSRMNRLVRAIETILTRDTRLDGFAIERAVPINEDMDKTPWVGVYKDRAKFEAHTIAAGADPWAVDRDVVLLVQAASVHSAADADDLLEEALWSVMSVLDNNIEISDDDGDLGVFIADYEVDYPEPGERRETYFQVAMITVTTEARS